MTERMRAAMFGTLRAPLERGARAVAARLPARLRQPPEYFEVIELHRLVESGQEAAVTPVLARRLARLLRGAVRHVPHYRETADMRPEDIRETTALEALKAFPYLDKATVMQAPERFLDERYPRSRLTYGTSGGSTGQGIGVWQDRREVRIERAFFDHEWGKLGYDRDRSRIVRFATEARKEEDDIPWGRQGNRLLVSPYHLNERWLPRIHARILEFEPEFFHTYPSCLEMLGRFMQREHLPPLRARGLLLASEAFTEVQHALFRETFLAPIKAHYGLSERSNLAFSFESPDGRTLAYRVDPVYGVAENRPDELGNQEIVGTSYWNQVMPLIRYRTQDFGRIEPDGTIRQLDGRSQEFLVTRDGDRIPGFSIKIDPFTWDYVSVYQVVQDRPGAIVLRLVPRPNFDDDVKARVLEKQRERWGGFFDISLELVADIPRTRSGKHRLIVSKLTATP
jgi:phenylacetate-CoA ligase